MTDKRISKRSTEDILGCVSCNKNFRRKECLPKMILRNQQYDYADYKADNNGISWLCHPCYDMYERIDRICVICNNEKTQIKNNALQLTELDNGKWVCTDKCMGWYI